MTPRLASDPDKQGIISLDPEMVRVLKNLGSANSHLYDGVINRIYSESTPGVQRLATDEVVFRLLSKEGLESGGTRITYGHRENIEGSYYTERAGDSMRYRVCGDHRAYLSGSEANFGFGDDPSRIGANGTAGELGKLQVLIECMDGVLTEALRESDEALASAHTNFNPAERDAVAASLLRLDDTFAINDDLTDGKWFSSFSGDFEPKGDRAITELDLIIAAAEDLKQKGVRVNPSVHLVLRITLAGIKRDVSEREAEFGPTLSVMAQISKIFGLFKKVGFWKKAEEEHAVVGAEQEKFDKYKANIIAKLEILQTLRAQLEDQSLGSQLGSDEFVSLALKYLGHEEPEMASSA